MLLYIDSWSRQFVTGHGSFTQPEFTMNAYLHLVEGKIVSR